MGHGPFSHACESVLGIRHEQRTESILARDEIAPKAEEMDREERFPYEIVAKMAALGLFGLPFPEEYGGAGADTVSYALAVMEIARADASTALRSSPPPRPTPMPVSCSAS